MENRKVILDSNIFIALSDEDDSLHRQANLLMENLKDSQILLPYCVIQEVTTILTYRFGKEKADSFLEGIQKSGDIFIINNQVEEEIDFYIKFRQKMSFTDIALVHLSKKYDALLFTFDKQLLNLYIKNK